MKNDFLFELGCEELPSKAVLAIADDLLKAIGLLLDKAGLEYQSIKHFATPRRIALLIQNLADAQPRQKIIKRGPSVQAAYDKEGKPSQALLGFAQSVQVTLKELQTKTFDKGEFIVFESEIPGSKTIFLLPKLL